MSSSTDQFIQFDATSAHKDVSQTTIPFIDGQDVRPQPSSWLAGAGLYHKVRCSYRTEEQFVLAIGLCLQTLSGGSLITVQ